MKLNIEKLDERIRQLQEVRRIAADPELVNILLEFITDEPAYSPSPRTAPEVSVDIRPADGADHLDVPPEASELIKELEKGAVATGSSLWGRHRDK